MSKSPLAPSSFPEVPVISGVSLATASVGIKYQNKDDLLLAAFSRDTVAAGVFTQSLTAGSPVLFCRQNLQQQQARGLLVNSGNANAFTGKAGDHHCKQMLEAVALSIGCRPEEVFPASTGVIGEPLSAEKILRRIPSLADSLDVPDLSCWHKAAAAMMTTDTFPKGATAKADIAGTEVTLSGIAKGSGMIAPDMATMLAFVFTDARLCKPVLQELLEQINHKTFNAITVDSDTSTSDTCLLFATGAAGNKAIEDSTNPDLENFKKALHSVMLDLAQQVIRDGEGATKLISVRVCGAENNHSAKTIARSIANSPLVKTAIAGEDANWGRVVMAVGKAGERADRDHLKIKMGGILITEKGQVVEGYDEMRVAQHLKEKEISIDVDVSVGSGEFTMWTCDLTHGYITINADYRS